MPSSKVPRLEYPEKANGIYLSPEFKFSMQIENSSPFDNVVLVLNGIV